jgi:hypothetical protein
MRKLKRRRAIACSPPRCGGDPLALLRAGRANGVVNEAQYRLALRQLLSRAGLLLGMVQKMIVFESDLHPLLSKKSGCPESTRKPTFGKW